MTTPNKDSRDPFSIVATAASTPTTAASVPSTDTRVTTDIASTIDQISSTLHGTPALRPEMVTALLAAIAHDKKSPTHPYWAISDFFDTISSVEELESVRHYCDSHGLLSNFSSEFPYCKKWLEAWERPEEALPKDFRKSFPLVSAKLDTPEKIRILLRFKEYINASFHNIGHILNAILTKHEVHGKDEVRYITIRDSSSSWWIHLPEEEQICRHVMLPEYGRWRDAISLRRLMFPDSMGGDIGEGYISIYWNKKSPGIINSNK